MKVRMKADVSGGRNGVEWPRRGGTVDLPKDEALQLCRNGIAEPVDSSADEVETATVPDDSHKRALTTETAGSTIPDAADPQPKAEEPTAETPVPPAPRRGRLPKAAPQKPAVKE
jgi:hypothetical protein